MKKNSILAMVVLALLGVCAALTHRVWSNQAKLDQLRAAIADVPRSPVAAAQPATEPLAIEEPPVQPPVLKEPNAAAPAAPSPTPASNVIADSYRQELDTLPSWLVIPEEKKDELARLTRSLNLPGLLAGYDDPEAEARIKAHVQRMDELREERQSQVQQLLGPATYTLWKEYYDSATARRFLSSLNSQPGAQVLPEDLLRTAAAAMTRGEQQVLAERRANNRFRNILPLSVKDVELEAQSRTRELELMRAAAMPYLSGAQRQAYDQLHDSWQKQGERQMERMRAMLTAREALAKEAEEKKRAAAGGG